MSRRIHSRLFLAIVLFCAAFSLAQAPKITKVDPPNWWTNFPHSPMLMITGENLSNAKVSVDTQSIRFLKSESSSDGHYLFVYTGQQNNAKAGTAHYKVQTSTGTASFDFELKSRAPLAGRAQGVNASDVIYLIMPDRFADGDPSNNDPPDARGHYNRNEQHAYHGGDLKGVTEHLGYLHELGVTTLWLTPWWKNDGNSADYHGYHVTDFYGVEDHFGTMKDLQELVAAAHRQGMKVLMDYVVNHVGPNNTWANDPPTPSWLHGSPQKHIAPQYNFWPLVDPHGTMAERAPVLDGWFVDKLPDLNCDDPKLSEYLTDNALWWMEIAGLDGYRLDTFPYSSRSFWSRWHEELFHVYPKTFTVGEVSDGDPAVVSFFQGGRKQYDGIDTGVTSVFDFPSFYAIREVLTQGAPATKLSQTLAHDALYPNPNELVTFIGNHDKKRFMGETGATVQTLNAAASLLITLRGIPEIYSGDEIAMPGGDDPDNRRDFPGGFPGDPKDAFTTAGRSAEQQEAFTHLQKLLQLRRDHKALQSGEQSDVLANAGSFAFLRSAGSDRVLMVLNSTSTAQAIHIAIAETPLASAHALAPLDSASAAQIGADGITVNVAPSSVAIYQVN
jgi:neopullulanase